MHLFDKVVFTGGGDFGQYKVVDTIYCGRKARVLFGDNHSPQSGMARDGLPELLFEYNQRFLEMIESVRPKKLLVIGGGVFMLPTAAFRRFSEMQIDVVEIDQILVDLAYEFFEAPTDSRFQVFVQDGETYVKNCNEKYDMIILDAFSGYTIPGHLLEYSAAELYNSHLSRSGVVAINFISRYAPAGRWLAHEIVDTFSQVFENVELYRADLEYGHAEEQNLVLAASQKKLQFDYLHSNDVIELLYKPL